MSNVSNIPVTPRVEKDKVGKHSFEVRYNPERKKWEWVCYVHASYQLHGEHGSLDLARAAAIKSIKKFMKQNGEDEPA